jgi:hypothetical protein
MIVQNWENRCVRLTVRNGKMLLLFFTQYARNFCGVLEKSENKKKSS